MIQSWISLWLEKSSVFHNTASYLQNKVFVWFSPFFLVSLALCLKLWECPSLPSFLSLSLSLSPGACWWFPCSTFTCEWPSIGKIVIKAQGNRYFVSWYHLLQTKMDISFTCTAKSIRINEGYCSVWIRKWTQDSIFVWGLYDWKGKCDQSCYTSSQLQGVCMCMFMHIFIYKNVYVGI